MAIKINGSYSAYTKRITSLDLNSSIEFDLTQKIGSGGIDRIANNFYAYIAGLSSRNGDRRYVISSCNGPLITVRCESTDLDPELFQ